MIKDFYQNLKQESVYWGDLQLISSLETRATTLAIRILRIILVLTTAFDLEST
jgi:hypothetical protein